MKLLLSILLTLLLLIGRSQDSLKIYQTNTVTRLMAGPHDQSEIQVIISGGKDVLVIDDTSSTDFIKVKYVSVVKYEGYVKRSDVKEKVGEYYYYTPVSKPNSDNQYKTPSKTNNSYQSQDKTPSKTNYNYKSTSTPTKTYSKSVQCSGRTQKGVRCKNMTTSPSGRCHYHD